MATDDLADRLADRLAARLGRAVVLYDADLDLVAFSAHAADVDPARASIILARRASDRAREMIRASGVHRGHVPVRIPLDERTGAPARVTYPVWHGRRLLGYVAYLDDATDGDPGVPADQQRALAELSGELAALLDRRRRLAESAQQEVADLLGALASSEGGRTAGEALVARGLVQPGPAYCTVVLAPGDRSPASQEGAGDALAEGLAAVLRLGRGTACGAVLGPGAVAVVPRRMSAAELATALDAAGAVVAGIGGPRSSPADLASSRREAGIAVRGPALLPGSYPLVAAWADLGVDRLLLQLPPAGLAPEDLPPAVTELLGTERGRALLSTLDCYLDCGGDVQETARRLVVHRSTLYYRLDRIREITGADLADGRTRRELHVGIRVAGMSGLLPALPGGGPG